MKTSKKFRIFLSAAKDSFTSPSYYAYTIETDDETVIYGRQELLYHSSAKTLLKGLIEAMQIVANTDIEAKDVDIITNDKYIAGVFTQKKTKKNVEEVEKIRGLGRGFSNFRVLHPKTTEELAFKYLANKHYATYGITPDKQIEKYG